MKLKQLKVENFGKLNNREISFEDGINIVYGPNESGKTTLHEFIKGMFYGITRQRGRASKNDLYTRYEPWENSNNFSGMLRFESGEKDFRITRNFYKNDNKKELICETDGERLSVDDGDMEMLLGDVSETVFDNTISIGQMRSRTDESLYQELRNYMTNYEGSGDWALDINQALKSLQTQKKEYDAQQRLENTQQEARKRELQMNINYLQNEIEQYEDKANATKKELMAKREAAQLETQKLDDIPTEDTEGKIVTKTSDGIMTKTDEQTDIVVNSSSQNKTGLLVVMILCLGLAVLSTVLLTKPLATYLAIAFVMASAVAGIIFWQTSKKSMVDGTNSEEVPADELEIEKKIAYTDLLAEKVQGNEAAIKLLEGKLSQLEEMCEEKKTQLENFQADYWEYTANTGEVGDSQKEIAALTLAMESIREVSVKGTHRMEKEFHQRISDILKEITKGRYDKVVLDSKQEIELYSDGKLIPLWTLSKGTIEQVYFSLRMAAAEIFCNEEMPIILDDVFVMYDEERLAAALAWLEDNKKQVVIFTCNTREAELASNLKLKANIIKL